MISHSVGAQFRLPTINLAIYEDAFFCFCRHLKEYSTCKLEEPREEEWENLPKVDYPIGIVRGQGLPDIKVMFIHYKTFEEAAQKWRERFARVNYDNLYLLMDRGMDARPEILDRFESLPYKNKVFFTHLEDPERWPSNFRFSYYSPERYEVACLYKPFHKGLAEYRWLDEFDFVSWLNDGTIQNTDICP